MMSSGLTFDKILPLILALLLIFIFPMIMRRYGLEPEDLIRRLMKDEGRWLRMLREGADSTYEAWGRDAKWNTSLFHLCYTYPVLFLCDWGMEDVFS